MPEGLEGMMEEMLAGMKGMLKSVATDKELAKLQATWYKNLFDALVAAGFTKEQALEILVNAPPPTQKQ